MTQTRIDHAHAQTIAAIAATLDSDIARGLTTAAATRRLAETGPNRIADARRRGPWRLLLAQFSDFMIVLLLAAAIVAGVLGNLIDTLVILAIVLLNAGIGFVQEYRAERAIAALKALAAPLARVLRDGETRSVAADTLVPGDVVLLEAGNIVPADLRLIESAALKIQEATLTGESVAVDKTAERLAARDAPLGDRHNMAFKGTVAVHGRAQGLVVATGMATELGRIAQLLHGTDETKTPLQRRLARFGQVLAATVLALCALLFALGVWRGEPMLLMLLTAISLAVAAIPEALPAVMSVALALGARRMVRHEVLIRKLPAVETLGSITVICSDKTGTLTLNRMRVEQLVTGTGVPQTPSQERPRDPLERELLMAMALNNDTRLDHIDRPIGDPTEIALYETARDAGLPAGELQESLPRVAELPFDPARQCMTTLHRHADAPSTLVAYVKGSPEKILSRCVNTWHPQGPQRLDRAAMLETAGRMAADGLRVLAFARRTFAAPPPLEPGQVEMQLEFLGLAGLLDPPRAEAAAAIADCRSAGIVPVMITGDHPETARAIARRLGLLDSQAEVLTGAALARMSDAEFARHARTVRVYARAAPEHKLRIVRTLQAQGEFVAMTGDGVNDAPALKRADIGVAMGVNGTDVARETAHMVLLDDNFASIVRAVREGRRIFDNIRKFIRFVMTGNFAEILVVIVPPFFGLPMALLPIQILWINLVTDGLPGLALSAEPAERGIMQRPPRPPTESIFARGMWQHILWVGLLMSAASLATLAWALHGDNHHWQSMVFTVLTLSQLGHVLAIRSERDALWTLGLGSNRPLLLAVVLTLGLQLATLYVPWLNPIFMTEPLTAAELAVCLALSSVVFVGVETEKWLLRRGGRRTRATA